MKNQIVTAALGLALLNAAHMVASDFTFVKIPASNSIQTNLVSTFPTGLFKAANNLKTPFEIPSKPDTCGNTGKGACNFYDGFGTNGNGQSITLTVAVPHPTLVYTLMNAYSAGFSTQIATIEFVGSSGTTETFPLIGGANIRDFFQGSFANSLNNGIPNMTAVNAFTCVAPATCLGAAGTGNVNDGFSGTYNLDEQEYALDAAFAGQNLVQIILTDTADNQDPILLGVTAMSQTTDAPKVNSFAPEKGKVDATVTIHGNGLIGATAVTFNGVPASFTVDTVLTITATVPAAATTGPIAVTTPHGTATSKTDFTVK